MCLLDRYYVGWTWRGQTARESCNMLAERERKRERERKKAVAHTQRNTDYMRSSAAQLG